MADGSKILMWAAIIFLGYTMLNGGLGGGGTTIVNNGGTGSGTGGGSTMDDLKGFIDVTVTFSSNDLLSKSTTAGTSHRIIHMGSNGALENIAVADDGTKTATAGQSYEVLIGNATQILTSTNGNGYYPVWVTGTLPSEKTATIDAGQPKTGALSFTFYNDDGTANTPQAIGSGEAKIMEVKMTAPSGACYGNPTTGKNNVMCVGYNSTRYEKPVLKNSVSAPKPQQINLNTAFGIDSAACYEFPVLCDNDIANGVPQPANSVYEFRQYLTIDAKSSINPSTDGPDLNITLSDVSIDYNTKTLAKIVGVEDETGADIGLADTQYGTYGLSVS